MKCNCKVQGKDWSSHRSCSVQGAAPGNTWSPPCPGGAGPAGPHKCNSPALRASLCCSRGSRQGLRSLLWSSPFLNAATCPSLRAPHFLPLQTGRKQAALQPQHSSTMVSPEGRNASPPELPLDLLSSNISHLNSF